MYISEHFVDFVCELLVIIARELHNVENKLFVFCILAKTFMKIMLSFSYCTHVLNCFGLITLSKVYLINNIALNCIYQFLTYVVSAFVQYVLNFVLYSIYCVQCTVTNPCS
jgi:hypothetical protein